MEIITTSGEFSVRKLFTVKEFVALPEFGYMTESAVRHLLFESQTRYAACGDAIAGNGLAECGAVVRMGKRVLIHAGKFREWQTRQQIRA